ncbi:MAG: hypothetical protein RLZZ09_1812 [Pseudomonadota bacterium]|jgi:hypothetical protein
MNPQLPASAAIYNRAMLAVYDAYVLGFSNRWVWRCPSARILALYDRHVAGRHLEVGVGTGYFPDHCRFPVAAPAIDLLDIHPDTLTTAGRRLRRYRPREIRANVLEPLPPLAGGYGSIAVNYLLHCLPGPLADKGRRVFGQLTPLLAPDHGCLFGATILGQGVPHNALGRRLMDLYNDKGIFGNRQDSEADLRRLLEEHFAAHELEIHGCVALFAGYRRRPAG